jgi:hypothetical protein
MAKKPGIFSGQLERGPDGVLWAVLYRGEVTTPQAIITQERVRSVRHGKRRVTQMLLAATDADLPSPTGHNQRSRPRPPTAALTRRVSCLCVITAAGW